MRQFIVRITALVLGLCGWACAQSGSGPCNVENSEQTLPQFSVGATLNNSTAAALTSDVNWVNGIIYCSGSGYWVDVYTEVDASISNSTFSGLTAFAEGLYVRHATSVVTNPVNNRQREQPDLNRLAHVLAFADGLETDGNLQNVSVLVEAGYIPLLSLETFALGYNLPGITNWAQVGAFVQAGYTTSLYQTPMVAPAQSGEQVSTDSSGALVRFKLGGSGEVWLPLPLPETQGLRFLPEVWVWYDVLDNRAYGLLEGALTLDLTEGVSYNLFSIKRGAIPPDFTPGTQFSTGLTIRF